MDEFCNGATYVSIDVLANKKDWGSKMLLLEDNGGGMNPDSMRQCMSLGYSVKSKLANTIGKYGNGFKTSSMRLGADVIVFSRRRDGATSTLTQSAGTSCIHFFKEHGERRYCCSYDRLFEEGRDLGDVGDQGTRIVIYNLWEDEGGNTELDFDTDPHDIQIRGVSRDEKKIEMAKEYPNSRHLLTYQHSLRSYASILYLRPAPGFRIILRGKDVEHHNLVNDMMLSEEITYRPQSVGYETSVAAVTVGFVKDAKHHIDIQGVLEANFVELAHDKQGFERTIVLARLEARLQVMQKKYWSSNCHFIGYAKRRNVKSTTVSPDQEEPNACSAPTSKSCSPLSSSVVHTTLHDDRSKLKSSGVEREMGPVHSSIKDSSVHEASGMCLGSGKVSQPVHFSIQARRQTMSGDQTQQVCTLNRQTDETPGNASVPKRKSCSPISSNVGHTTCQNTVPLHSSVQERNQTMPGNHTQQASISRNPVVKMEDTVSNDLREENNSTKNSLHQVLRHWQHERARSKTLARMLIEERRRGTKEEESLKSKLKDASVTIQYLLNKVRLLESSRITFTSKNEHQLL
ncbi:hypothetical protein HAX54_042532 [Datura stramonium]|uniref:Morc S5 domain-containing protein n=1 Tax=Datura stramonium TaxID=4076 RepID=A0ABS8W008_DATST|nr:hypothetical protein [Datura stramonium]